MNNSINISETLSAVTTSIENTTLSNFNRIDDLKGDAELKFVEFYVKDPVNAEDTRTEHERSRFVFETTTNKARYELTVKAFLALNILTGDKLQEDTEWSSDLIHDTNVSKLDDMVRGTDNELLSSIVTGDKVLKVQTRVKLANFNAENKDEDDHSIQPLYQASCYTGYKEYLAANALLKKATDLSIDARRAEYTQNFNNLISTELRTSAVGMEKFMKFKPVFKVI